MAQVSPKPGLRDFCMQVALGRLVAICTFGESLGRQLELRDEDDACIVFFDRPPPPAKRA
jgi:hypothetical protein